MGRKRKPTAAHKRDGTFNVTRHGSRADNVIEFDGEPEQIVPLKGDALALWHHLMDTLPNDVLKRADSTLMTLMCETWGRYRMLLNLWQRLLARNMNQTLEAGDSETREDKHVYRQMRQAQNDFTQLAKDFGMTPCDRAKLMASKAGQDKPDPIAAMLQAHFANN